MVASALADRLGAATVLAVIVTLGGVGRFAGAVYKPEVEIDPHVDPAQPVPATDHITVGFVVPLTVAEYCCCRPRLTWAVDGDTETDTAAADSIVTVAEADFAGAATDVAVTVAFGDLGITAGAV